MKCTVTDGWNGHSVFKLGGNVVMKTCTVKRNGRGHVKVICEAVSIRQMHYSFQLVKSAILDTYAYVLFWQPKLIYVRNFFNYITTAKASFLTIEWLKSDGKGEKPINSCSFAVLGSVAEATRPTALLSAGMPVYLAAVT